MRKNLINVHHKNAEPWQVTLLDTGDTIMTGGRLKRVRQYVHDETFCFSHSDSLADVDIIALIAHHRASYRLDTVTVVSATRGHSNLAIMPP